MKRGSEQCKAWFSLVYHICSGFPRLSGNGKRKWMSSSGHLRHTTLPSASAQERAHITFRRFFLHLGGFPQLVISVLFIQLLLIVYCSPVRAEFLHSVYWWYLRKVNSENPCLSLKCFSFYFALSILFSFCWNSPKVL